MAHLVIVTGGSAGLGRAVLACAPAGAELVTVSRRPAEGVASHHIPADLSEPTAWARVGTALRERVHRRRWARITLVQAAGTLEPIGFAGEVAAQAYEDHLLVNAVAPLALGHRYLEVVRDLPGRRELVLVSSGAARSAYPGWSAYGAAKAALDRWVSTVGEEQRHRGGVRVLSIAPGVVDTGMQALIRGTDARDFPQVGRFLALHRDGRLVAAEEAAAGVWAVLDDQAVTTGSVVDLRDR